MQYFEIVAGHGSLTRMAVVEVAEGQFVRGEQPFSVHTDSALLLLQGVAPAEVEQRVWESVGDADFTISVRQCTREEWEEWEVANG